MWAATTSVTFESTVACDTLAEIDALVAELVARKDVDVTVARDDANLTLTVRMAWTSTASGTVE